MLFDFATMPVQAAPHVQGGEGELLSQMYVKPGEMKLLKGRLAPGCSIGLHTHTTNLEVYYILSGSGALCDDGETVRITAGQAHYCPKGHSHSLRNDGNEDLIFFAIIPEVN